MNDRATATLPQPHADHVRGTADVWDTAAPRVLYHDGYREIYCTAHCRPTCRALYGWAPYRWLRDLRHVSERVRNRRSLQRWQSSDRSTFLLPADAIVMPRKRGVTVIASASEGRVMKISSAPTGIRLMDHEGMAWKIAQEAGIESHVPEIFDQGSVAESTSWISIQLTPNHYPFWERLRGVWQRWLARKGLPVLQRFYAAAGVTSDTTASCWDAIGEGDDFHASRKLASMLAEAREGAGDSTQYSSLTHGDLGPIHVHRTRNQWAIIDWARLDKRPLWMEFFVEYLRYPQSQHYQRPAFWQWLRGDIKEHAIPSILQKDMELYLTWLNRWQGANQGAADLRYQILLWLYTPLKQAREARERAPDAVQATDTAVPYTTHSEQMASALHLT